MRTSSEKHLVEQLQLVLTLCGKVSSWYTMLHEGLWDDAALFGHFYTFKSNTVQWKMGKMVLTSSGFGS